MSLIYADRVREIVSINGNTVVFGGGLPGFQSFQSRLTTGDTCYYCIENMSTPGQWETGIGLFNADKTMTRQSIFESSSEDSFVNFDYTSTYHCFITLPGKEVQDNNLTNLEFFGDGSDGNVTISSGTTTLTRDMYYNNLTMSGTGVLVNGGWRIFVRGTLDLTNATANAIQSSTSNGGNGTVTVAGTAAGQLPSRSISGSDVAVAGVAGGATTGTNGITNTVANAYAGGRSGNAGTGGTGASGAGGTGAAATVSSFPVDPRNAATQMIYFSTYVKGGMNGPSGGSGGGDATAGGGSGAGGGQGPVVGIWANKIVRSTSGSVLIRAIGGNGGNGGVPAGGNRGGGGAGGGGGGGFVYIVTRGLFGQTKTGAINVSGGNGGTGGAATGTGTAGAGGNGGNGGRVTIIDVQSGIVTSTDFTALTGGAAAGATGGTGAAGLADL